jgi:hypothetical protein
MKNFLRIAQSVGLLCSIGAFGLAVLNFLAVIAASFGFTRPFRYFQYFRIPYWSVLLPALGILTLLPLALHKAFTYRSEPEGERLIRLMDWRRAVNRWRSRLHLRSV